MKSTESLNVNQKRGKAFSCNLHFDKKPSWEKLVHPLPKRQCRSVTGGCSPHAHPNTPPAHTSLRQILGRRSAPAAGIRTIEQHQERQMCGKSRGDQRCPKQPATERMPCQPAGGQLAGLQPLRERRPLMHGDAATADACPTNAQTNEPPRSVPFQTVRCKDCLGSFLCSSDESHSTPACCRCRPRVAAALAGYIPMHV